MARKHRQPPTPEQIARLNRELERVWQPEPAPERPEVPAPARPGISPELDARVDAYLKQILGI